MAKILTDDIIAELKEKPTLDNISSKLNLSATYFEATGSSIVGYKVGKLVQVACNAKLKLQSPITL